MIIIPAIDLKDGKCVRLRQGVADDVKVYSDDPVEMAKHWEQEGARYLHVVDLDGAFEGRSVHSDVVAKIVNAVSMPVEIGGGLRSDEDVRRIVDCGVDRAIIGTRAFRDPDSLARLVESFGRHIAVGIDARGGMVQIEGWVETTGLSAVDLAIKSENMGVSTIIYTDTATDGMMAGTNVPAIDEICGAVNCDIIASGGITTEADVFALKNLRRKNLAGAIVGKALYEKTISLSSLQKG